MSRARRGVRDGTGPYRDSYQRRSQGDIGRRRQAGQRCPFGKPFRQNQVQEPKK